MGTAVKTSIRLVLTALAVGGITFAASGKPLPFLGSAHQARTPTPVLLPPDIVDGPAPGAGFVAARADSTFPAALSSFDYPLDGHSSNPREPLR
jgi:hypothetical protein